MTVFALADCNNFYVSCERVFKPELNGKPVIVLSNNDGCAVARSNEVKTLGVKMGVPFFKLKHIIKNNNINVFSSNYALYGDMSNRVMQTLSMFTPAIEIYSIDEAFLDLTNFVFTDLTSHAHSICNKVKKDTGLPISIGIATSKTLAKIANKIAKKSLKTDGVLDLTLIKYQDKALELTRIEDVWGIGRRYSAYLKLRNIKTALDFKYADTRMIKQKMGINGIRTQKELCGESCYPLDVMPATRKSISVSSSFKIPVTNFDDLSQALSLYISRGAVKLREQNSFAETMTVYVMTNRFKTESFYYNSKTIILPTAINTTPELIKNGKSILKQIFQTDKQYKKTGIVFSKLVKNGHVQQDLFDTTDKTRTKKLMKAMDKINSKMGRHCAKYAATGLSKHQAWKTAFNYRSPAYTTDWNQLLNVC